MTSTLKGSIQIPFVWNKRSPHSAIDPARPVLLLATLMALACAPNDATDAAAQSSTQAEELSALGAAFYVDRNNRGGTCDDSNPGTLSRPFCTISKGLSVAQPGDTIFIRAGTYPTQRIRGKSGTASLPITLRAYPGEERRAVISGSEVGSGIALRIESSNFLVIQALRITRAQKGIFVDGCRGVTLSNNQAHEIGMEAIHVFRNSANIQIIGNEIFNLGLANPNFGEGIYVGTGGYPGAFNVAFPDNTHDIIVRGNHIHNDGRAAAEGINIKGETYRVTVEKNTVHHIEVGNGGGISIDKMATDRQWEPGRHREHVICDNVVHHITTRTSFSDGNGIRTYGPGATICNNVLYDNEHYGVAASDADDYNQLVRIYHNTVGYNRGSNDAGGVHLYSSPTVDVKNNIGSSRAGNMPFSEPLFVNAPGRDFHLRPGSPAIDVATDVGVRVDFDDEPRPLGRGFDMGADEYRP
jgi:parallel beta-helix repeat protein